MVGLAPLMFIMGIGTAMGITADSGGKPCACFPRSLFVPFLMVGTDVPVGSRSFCSANKHMNASLPALCRVHCGSTRGGSCCCCCSVGLSPEPEPDGEFGVRGRVNEYNKFSKDRLEPETRTLSPFGSCITPRWPSEYRVRS